MKPILILALFLVTTYANAMNCTDFTGSYQLQTFRMEMIQSDCKQVKIVEEFGTEILVIDGITRTETDHNGSMYTSLYSWSADRKQIVISKEIEVGGEVIFRSIETYSLLPNGNVQLKSVDAFRTSSPQTLVYEYERIRKNR